MNQPKQISYRGERTFQLVKDADEIENETVGLHLVLGGDHCRSRRDSGRGEAGLVSPAPQHGVELGFSERAILSKRFLGECRRCAWQDRFDDAGYSQPITISIPRCRRLKGAST